MNLEQLTQNDTLEKGEAVTDKQMRELYQLKEGQLSFEAEPNQKEIILNEAEKLGLKVEIVDSKVATPGIAVILEGGYNERDLLVKALENKEKE